MQKVICQENKFYYAIFFDSDVNRNQYVFLKKMIRDFSRNRKVYVELSRHLEIDKFEFAINRHYSNHSVYLEIDFHQLDKIIFSNYLWAEICITERSLTFDEFVKCKNGNILFNKGLTARISISNQDEFVLSISKTYKNRIDYFLEKFSND